MTDKNLEKMIMHMYEDEFTHHEIAEEVAFLENIDFEEGLAKVTNVILKNQKMPVGGRK